MIVDCSVVPASRPAALGSGNAPARPGMPPGGPELASPELAGPELASRELAGPVRPAVLRWSALASASTTPAAVAAW